MELKTPSPSATPPPERFLRGRQKRSRPTRRIGKLLLKGAVIVLGMVTLLAALMWTVTAAGNAPELSVHRILVEGNAQLSDGEILELLELSRSTNILMLDLEEVRAKLLRSAWVADVEIVRVLPGTLELDIRERHPVAIAVLDELYLLASDGTILDQLSPRYDIQKLVLVRGLQNDGAIDPGRAALAGRLSAALFRDERLNQLVSELDVTDGPDSVVLRLRAPAMRVLVDDDDMVERLVEVAPLLEGIRGRYGDLEVVDLRFEGRAYLRLKEPNVSTRGEMPTRAALDPGGASF